MGNRQGKSSDSVASFLHDYSNPSASMVLRDSFVGGSDILIWDVNLLKDPSDDLHRDKQFLVIVAL